MKNASRSQPKRKRHIAICMYIREEEGALVSVTSTKGELRIARNKFCQPSEEGVPPIQKRIEYVNAFNLQMCQSGFVRNGLEYDQTFA